MINAGYPITDIQLHFITLLFKCY